MTDNEFESLQDEIHLKMVELFRLQELHERETGRRYVIGGPLPKRLEFRLKPVELLVDALMEGK